MDDPNIKKTTEELAFLKDAINSIGETVKESLNSRLEESDSILQRIQNNIKKDTTKAILDLGKGFDGALKSQILLTQGALKQSDIQKQRNDLLNKEKSIQIALEQAKMNGLMTDIEIEDVLKEINNQTKFQNALLDKQEKELSRINASLGVSGKLVQGISKIPVLGNLIDSAELLAKTQEKAAEKGSSKLKVLGEVGKQVGKSLVTNLTDPLVVFSAITAGIVSSLKMIDQLTSGTARNFGISKGEANDLNKELSGIARSSNDSFITTKKLNEAFISLNDRYGTFANFSDATLVTFTELTKKAGISAEAVGALQDTTFLTGKNLKETTAEYEGQVKALKAQTGLAINEKQVLEGIKNVSAATKLQLGGSAEAIASAVFKAKALGMELKDLASISDSLLNFQSSIENELSAELLTGKQLNLEGARYAALMGDQATLADEIAKNIGSAADFQKMNVVRQDALAKSLGLTRDTLAETLMQREALTKLGAKDGETQKEAYDRLVEQYGVEEARKRIGDESLAKQMESVSMQEKFASITEKLQEAFIPIAEALLPIVDGFASLASHATTLKVVLTAIATIMGGKMLASLALNAASMGMFGKKAKEAAMASVVGAAAESGKSAAQIPVVGWAMAIGAMSAMAAAGYALFKGDDLFSPGGGGGYGKRTLLAPEGAFALNDNDNIVATTNPINANDLISKPKGSINVAPQQMSQRSEIKVAPSNTQIAINLDGAALGNASARLNYSVGSNIKSLGGKVDYSAPI